MEKLQNHDDVEPSHSCSDMDNQENDFEDNPDPDEAQLSSMQNMVQESALVAEDIDSSHVEENLGQSIDMIGES